MAEVDYSDPSNSAVKPGKHSVEWYAHLIAQVVAGLLYSGMLSPADPIESKILKFGGVFLAIAAPLGLYKSRTDVKTNASDNAAAIAVAEVQAKALTAGGPSVPSP